MDLLFIKAFPKSSIPTTKRNPDKNIHEVHRVEDKRTWKRGSCLIHSRHSQTLEKYANPVQDIRSKIKNKINGGFEVWPLNRVKSSFKISKWSDPFFFCRSSLYALLCLVLAKHFHRTMNVTAFHGTSLIGVYYAWNNLFKFFCDGFSYDFIYNAQMFCSYYFVLPCNLYDRQSDCDEWYLRIVAGSTTLVYQRAITKYKMSEQMVTASIVRWRDLLTQMCYRVS